MALDPFAYAFDVMQNYPAFTKQSTYTRDDDTISSITMTQGQTTADMIDTYNILTPEAVSVWYIAQADLDFGDGAVSPRSGDIITAPDGTVYSVTQYEPNQDNIDWRLIAVREEI